MARRDDGVVQPLPGAAPIQNQLLRGNGRHRHGGFARPPRQGQRMRRRDREHHRLFEHRYEDNLRGIPLRLAYECNVQLPVAQAVEQLACTALVEHQRDGWRIASEGTNHRRHERVQCCGTGQAYRQPSLDAGRDAAHVVDRLIEFAHDLVRVAKKRLAGVGERHAARQALEERHAQLAFQHPDLLRERRLSDAQTLGRARHVPRFSHRNEVAQ